VYWGNEEGTTCLLTHLEEGGSQKRREKLDVRVADRNGEWDRSQFREAAGKRGGGTYCTKREESLAFLISWGI